jgi:hypothetical protein
VSIYQICDESARLIAALVQAQQALGAAAHALNEFRVEGSGDAGRESQLFRALHDAEREAAEIHHALHSYRIAS